jgi:hypothetical protein
MIRAGVKLYKWCRECDRVTEHGVGLSMFCREHPYLPWELLYPPPLPHWVVEMLDEINKIAQEKTA